jgi:hypothetical protein
MKAISRRLFFLTLILVGGISCSNPEGDRNHENLKKVKLNMHMDEVLKIMGSPVYVEILPFRLDFYRFIYEAPRGSSGKLCISVSRKDSLVAHVYDGS